jgi:acyl-coenzyme A thioesterase PaaI-like protein
MLSRPPTSGRIHLACRPLRVGSRLIVGETLLRADDTEQPFGRALTTFMNISVGDGLAGNPTTPSMAHSSFDEFIRPRITGDRTIEIDSDSRLTIHGGLTVQGGVQALLAELAAEHAFGGGRRLVATDLDIRFLGRVRVGPLLAIAEGATVDEGPIRARVTLRDAGFDDSLVAYVTLTLEAVAPSPL